MTLAIETIETKSYDYVENMFHNGRISDDEWSAYRIFWRDSSPRFSNLVPDYLKPTPEQSELIAQWSKELESR